MAVAKSRKTPSTRGMRRSHDALKTVQLATDPTSGEVHRRHHVTKDGYYRGLEQEFVRPDGMLNFYRSARTGIGQNGASFSTDLRRLIPR